jgi:hypothetical protein
MKPGKNIQKQVDDCMESIEGIERAEAPPFFYTRLQARLEMGITRKTAGLNLFAKPVLSLVTLSVLLILNIAAIRYFEKPGTVQKEKAASGIEQFAKEYDMEITSLYQDKK